MSDNAVLDAILDLKGDMGKIQAGLEGHQRWMQQHVADDRLVEARVTTIERERAVTKGKVSVWGTVGAGAAAGIGYASHVLAAYLKSRGG